MLRYSYKGKAFEKILYDILKGDLICHYDLKYHHGLVRYSLVPRSELSLTDSMNETVYSYSDPNNAEGFRFKINEKNDAFISFLKKIEKEQTDIDLFLFSSEPLPHILVGECHFTKKYNYYHYSKKRGQIKELAEFLGSSQDAKTKLGIPDYPVIPVLFTSFSGPLSVEKDGVIKATLPIVVSGKLNEWIHNFFVVRH